MTFPSDMMDKDMVYVHGQLVMVDMDHLKDLSGTFGLVVNLGFNPVSPMPGKPFAEADFSK